MARPSPRISAVAAIAMTVTLTAATSLEVVPRCSWSDPNRNR
jgi:hypothetical protein